MSKITIPPAAMKAAYSAFASAMGDDKPALEAACLAMLRSWPGMWASPIGISLPLTEKPGHE